MNIFATIMGCIFEIYIGHMFFSKFGEKRVSTKTINYKNEFIIYCFYKIFI